MADGVLVTEVAPVPVVEADAPTGVNEGQASSAKQHLEESIGLKFHPRNKTSLTLS